MEKRYANIIINKAGGNASKNSVNYKISIPTKWVKDMEISENERMIELEYKEESKEIILKKVDHNIKEKKEPNHD